MATRREPEQVDVADIKVSAGIPVYLFHGTDEYRVAEAARKVVNGLCPEAEQMFGVEEIAGTADNAEQVVALLRRCLVAVQTLGFASTGKVVWLRNAEFLDDGNLLRATAVQPWMAELTELVRRGIPAGHKLVVSCPGVDGRSAFYKACDAAGMAVGFDIPEKSRQVELYALKTVEQAFVEAGIEPGPGVLEEVARRVGADSRIAQQEVQKLAVYLGDRRQATAADVAAIVSHYREAEVWDLADRAGDRDLPGALAVLKRLLAQKEEPIRLLNALETRFRELALVRDAAERGWIRMSDRQAHFQPEADEAMAALGEWDIRRTHPFRLGILLGQSQKFEPRELVRAGNETTKAREQAVGGFGTPELLVELLLLKLLAPVRRRAAAPVGA